MAEPPKGTVTLVLTDMEGSTGLVQQLGDEYPALLATHDRLVREAFAGRGGYEVEQLGDGFLYAFAHAADALAAAEAAQRALAAEQWPGDVAVRVRMGIHTGRPTFSNGTYVGLDVNRAARISNAGHGGQVLLSQTASQAVRDRGALRDLGEHGLRGIDEPERLFQLVIDGLPADFPQLQTLSNTNLPVPATRLIGRRRERGEVRALVRSDGVRLVTLTGPGGTGKTRLALESALELVGSFPDGVFLVNLAAVTEPEGLLPEVALALGVSEEPERPLGATLEGHLRHRTLLLVLDNMEQVGAAAPLVGALLAAAPALKALATSREPLHIGGEHEYPVPPLAEDEATALFDERARAVLPSYEPTELDGAAVREVCRRLDCLPLAIELAAARIKLLSPRALEGRLTERLAVLTGGGRDLPERHRTLRATIDWSYDLLAENEQRVFARLGVFPSSCALEAAEAVGDASLDHLYSLVDKSLVVRLGGDDDGPRFELLETIREYALERLRELGEEDERRRRHALHYLELAERARDELRGPDQATWLGRLDAEHENLRAALEWLRASPEVELDLRLAAALGRFWLVRALYTEGREQLEAALSRVDDATPRQLRARVLTNLSGLAIMQGDADRAEACAEESLELSRELDDRIGVVGALTIIAHVQLQRGDIEGARVTYAETVELVRELNDPLRLASAIGNLGYVTIGLRDIPAARALFEEALALFTEHGNEEAAARSMLNVGFIAWSESRLEDARRSFLDALAIFRRLRGADGIAYVLEGLAAVAGSEGEHAAAARLLGGARVVREEIGLHLDPFEQEAHDETASAAAEALGHETFERTQAAAADEGVDAIVATLVASRGGPAVAAS